MKRISCLILALPLFVASCNKDADNTKSGNPHGITSTANITSPSGFDWKTTRSVSIDISALAIPGTKQVIKVDDYADFYQQINDFSGHSQSLFVYQKPSKLSVDNITVGSDTAGKIQQTKSLLESSQFDEALVAIQEVIASDDSNGEAQYLLGLALGFTGDDANSELAFERAEQLGYQF